MSAACYFCTAPVQPGDVVNMHHPVYKSRGGQAVKPAHKTCHVAFHSNQNDFKEWGRKGGQETARRGWWIWNLKRGSNPPDPLRYITFGKGQV
ncbi:MAG: hypothetical protein WBV94_14825 [Blastocatellia bacterium]